MILSRLFNRQTTADKPGPRFIQVPQRQAGIRVDHDSALKTSAVFACIRVISEDIAGLPWHVYSRRNDGYKEFVLNHPAYSVLNRRPNPEMSPYSFKQTLMSWVLSWGNGYAEIERDRAGRVAWLWPIPPDRVEVHRTEGGIVYEIMNSRKDNTFLDARDMFHVHGLGFDGVTGYSVISLAATSIGMTQAAENFGASFFGNGTRLGGVIEIPSDSRLNDEGKVNLKKTFNEKNQGPYNTGKTEVLDAGMKYTQIGIPPEDAQFLETRQFQVEDICRWYRVAPQKVAHLLRMTFNNVEQLSIDHVQDTLMPFIKPLEEEADYKLFGATNTRLYTKLNTNGLLRGDTEARTKYYREMFNLGALSPDEIREMEDMNPVRHGDKRFIQMNMTTLEKAGEDIPAPAPPPKTKPGNDADENTNNNTDDNDDTLNAARILLQDKLETILDHEHRYFIDLSKRYTDRQEYIERVAGFLGGNKERVIKAVEKHVAKALSAKGVDHTQASSAANIYYDKHKDVSRAQAIRLYDNQTYLDPKARAANVADKLVTTINLFIEESHV